MHAKNSKRKYKCKTRNKPINNQDYSLEVYSVEHNLFYKCNNCDYKEKILSNILSDDKERIKNLNNTTGPYFFNNNSNYAGVGYFSINKKLVMADQLTGNGTKESRVYSNFFACWFS